MIELGLTIIGVMFVVVTFPIWGVALTVVFGALLAVTAWPWLLWIIIPIVVLKVVEDSSR